MKRATAVIVSVCVGIVVFPGVGAAQTATRVDAVPCGALGPLLDEVRRIASALEAQQATRMSDVDLRRLEIAVAYLDLRMREIERLERSLTAARDRRAVLTDSLSERATLIGQFEAEARVAGGDEAEEMRQMVDRAREAQEELERQLVDAERRVLDLENEIADARRQVRMLDDLVASHLTLLE